MQQAPLPTHIRAPFKHPKYSGIVALMQGIPCDLLGLVELRPVPLQPTAVFTVTVSPHFASQPHKLEL